MVANSNNIEEPTSPSISHPHEIPPVGNLSNAVDPETDAMSMSHHTLIGAHSLSELSSPNDLCDKCVCKISNFIAFDDLLLIVELNSGCGVSKSNDCESRLQMMLKNHRVHQLFIRTKLWKLE
jgi:hypothetical protein